MNLTLSDRGRVLLDQVSAFMAEHIEPVEDTLLKKQRSLADPWVELAEVRALKEQARDAGLWNLFLPKVSGLSVLDYAHLAERMGWSVLAPEVFNRNAPTATWRCWAAEPRSRKAPGWGDCSPVRSEAPFA